MAAISVNNIAVLNNPAPFLTPLKFEITFEAHVALEADVDWTVTYVGSGDNQQYDQVLDSVAVGPIGVGVSRFTLETPAPDAARIPADDLLGSTICFVSCAYRGQEFVRVGYWVSNAYSEPLAEGEEPPMPCPTDKIVRTILDERPRVTKWTISWGE
jgi:histone chaperone ASF1